MGSMKVTYSKRKPCPVPSILENKGKISYNWEKGGTGRLGVREGGGEAGVHQWEGRISKCCLDLNILGARKEQSHIRRGAGFSAK